MVTLIIVFVSKMSLLDRMGKKKSSLNNHWTICSSLILVSSTSRNNELDSPNCFAYIAQKSPNKTGPKKKF